MQIKQQLDAVILSVILVSSFEFIIEDICFFSKSYI